MPTLYFLLLLAQNGAAAPEKVVSSFPYVFFAIMGACLVMIIAGAIVDHMPEKEATDEEGKASKKSKREKKKDKKKKGKKGKKGADEEAAEDEAEEDAGEDDDEESAASESDEESDEEEDEEDEDEDDEEDDDEDEEKEKDKGDPSSEEFTTMTEGDAGEIDFEADDEKQD